MKKSFYLFLILGLSFSLIGCGESSDKSSNKKVVEKKEKEPSLSPSDIQLELSKISSEWLTSDYWNDSVVEIKYYLTTGKSATGGELDIELILRSYHKAYKKVDEYNKFISALDKETYEDILFTWEKLYPEMIRINDYVTSHEIVASGDLEFNLDLFVQYRDAFQDAVSDLEEN